MLFERTGHIIGILQELRFMVETVEDFSKFLGPELKAVTGDTEVQHCWSFQCVCICNHG